MSRVLIVKGHAVGCSWEPARVLGMNPAFGVGYGHPRLTAIAAVDRNGAIGLNGGIPWHLPEDLAHFKRVTEGGIVIMGRKTWESLPASVRPLPGRINIVISRDTRYVAEGALVYTGLFTALCATDNMRKPRFVIGGAQVYKQAADLVEKVILTKVDVESGGDAFFPSAYEKIRWGWVSSQHFPNASIPYQVVTYEGRAL